MTQFELEQAIMGAWGIVEDIQLLRQTIEHFKLQPKEYDNLDNYLLGLETIYQRKFENVFSLFEKLLWEAKHGN
jgi:hypothetical protein